MVVLELQQYGVVGFGIEDSVYVEKFIVEYDFYYGSEFGYDEDVLVLLFFFDYGDYIYFFYDDGLYFEDDYV